MAFGRGSEVRARGSGATTYPEHGLIVRAPTTRVGAEAAHSKLGTASAAIAPAKRSRAFGWLFTAGRPVASLHTVTDRYSITAGVSPNVPYQAWVVSARGPVIFIGRPGSESPPVGTRCTNVAIYDLDISKWTEALQNC